MAPCSSSTGWSKRGARRADASDGRVSRVHATPKAVELMRVLVKAHARELRQHEQLLVRSLAAVRRLEKIE